MINLLPCSCLLVRGDFPIDRALISFFIQGKERSGVRYFRGIITAVRCRACVFLYQKSRYSSTRARNALSSPAACRRQAAVTPRSVRGSAQIVASRVLRDLRTQEYCRSGELNQEKAAAPRKKDAVRIPSQSWVYHYRQQSIEPSVRASSVYSRAGAACIHIAGFKICQRHHLHWFPVQLPSGLCRLDLGLALCLLLLLVMAPEFGSPRNTAAESIVCVVRHYLHLFASSVQGVSYRGPPNWDNPLLNNLKAPFFPGRERTRGSHCIVHISSARKGKASHPKWSAVPA